jgi:hypothetical protein
MTNSSTPETYRAAVTHVVIGQGHWGSGPDLDRAKTEFRKQGGWLTRGYAVMVFDREHHRFVGVDGMGAIHWDILTDRATAPEPVVTEHPAKGGSR